MTYGTIWKIGADIAGFEQQVRRAQKIQENFARDLNRVGKALAPLSAALTGVGVAAVASAIKVDDALDTIRIGTGATGKALGALEDSFRRVAASVPNALEDSAKAIADLNTRTGATGVTLERLATQTLTLARLTKSDLGTTIATTTRLFGDWSVASDRQADTLDMLFRASQATGIGVTDLAGKLVQFGAPMRQFGLSLGESATLLGKFEKEGVNTELVLGSLRIAMGKFAREGIGMREGLDRTIAQIQALGPGAEATALAMEKFGARAGPDMAAAILEGRFALGELYQTVISGRETIESAATATDGFVERFRQLKNQVMLALEPLGKRLVEALERLKPHFLWLVERFTELIEKFSMLDPKWQTVILGIGGIAAVAAPAAFWVSSLASAFAGLSASGALGALARLAPLAGAAAGVGMLGVGAMLAKADMDRRLRAMQQGDGRVPIGEPPKLGNLGGLGLSLESAKAGLAGVAVAAQSTAGAIATLTDAQEKLQDRLFGRDVIQRALDFSAAIGNVNRVSRLSAEIQDEVAESVTAALGAFERMGQRAPTALLNLATALRDAAGGRVGVLASTVDDAVTSLADSLDRAMDLQQRFATVAAPNVGAAAQRVVAAFASMGADVGAHLSQVREGLEGLSNINTEWVMRFGTGLDRAKLKAEQWRQHALQLVQHLKDTLPERWQEAVDRINAITQDMVDEFTRQASVVERVLTDAFVGAISSAASARTAGEVARSFIGSFLNAIPVIGPAFNALFGSLSTLAIFGDGDSATRQRREVERLQRVQAQVAREFSDMSGALQRMGGVAPRALQPMIDALLRTRGLTEDMRRQLEAMKGPAGIDALRRAAERYGKTLDELGKPFAQLDLVDTFDQLFSDFTLLTDVGEDSTGVFEAMAEQVNKALERARRLGLSIPAFMRPMLEAFLEAGYLTDEFGKKLDNLEGFTFSDEFKSSMDAIAERLERIAEAFERISGAFLPERSANPEELPGDRFAGPRGGGTVTVNVVAEGRTLARLVTPWLPDEVQTLRLA